MVSESGFTVFVAFACGSAKAEQSKPELQPRSTSAMMSRRDPCSRLLRAATDEAIALRKQRNAAIKATNKNLPLNSSRALTLMRSAADAEISCALCAKANLARRVPLQQKRRAVAVLQSLHRGTCQRTVAAKGNINAFASTVAEAWR